MIKGIEITRAKPLGHINALFITDANPIETPEPLDAVNEAYRQGAFIMWNHPGWPDDRCTMYDVHEQLIKEGKIHGVEVFNSAEYYPKTIDWCRDLKLAFLANSDIHSTTGDSYHPKPLGRPVTLVLAKERSEAGIREAMFAGRTIALFDDLLAGPEALLTGLVKASIDRRVISSDEQGELVELPGHPVPGHGRGKIDQPARRENDPDETPGPVHDQNEKLLHGERASARNSLPVPIARPLPEQPFRTVS